MCADSDSAMNERAQLRATIIDLLEARDAGKIICPSEAARTVFGGASWRGKMPLVREVSAELVASGEIEVSQKGQVVELSKVRGPIRLRLAGRVQEV